MANSPEQTTLDWPIVSPQELLANRNHEWIIGEALQFMQANPQLVDELAVVADKIIESVDDSKISTFDMFKLSPAEPINDEGRFPGSSASESSIGIMLTLDYLVKQRSGKRFYINGVEEKLYPEIQFPDEDKPSLSYEGFGLVAADYPGKADDYICNYVVALSKNRRHAVIIPRLHDAEIKHRGNLVDADKAIGAAETLYNWKQEAKSLKLRKDVRDLLLSSRMSRVTQLALIRTLGEPEMIYLTAGEKEQDLLEPVHLPERSLRIAKILLESEANNTAVR